MPIDCTYQHGPLPLTAPPGWAGTCQSGSLLLTAPTRVGFSWQGGPLLSLMMSSLLNLWKTHFIPLTLVLFVFKDFFLFVNFPWFNLANLGEFIPSIYCSLFWTKHANFIRNRHTDDDSTLRSNFNVRWKFSVECINIDLFNYPLMMDIELFLFIKNYNTTTSQLWFSWRARGGW